jgi:hypothetical protein
MPALPGMQIMFVDLAKFRSSPLARKVIELQVMSVRGRRFSDMPTDAGNGCFLGYFGTPGLLLTPSRSRPPPDIFHSNSTRRLPNFESRQIDCRIFREARLAGELTLKDVHTRCNVGGPLSRCQTRAHI